MKIEIKAKYNEAKDIQDRINEIDAVLKNTELIKLNKKDFSNLLKTAKEQIKLPMCCKKTKLLKCYSLT